ncbi:E3 ubiquitin-protein ligase NRDP1 [Blomia tropicalis]|nr:E3 ubiquitin-protein ligase NRDP1 [Blomia tropicalis]
MGFDTEQFDDEINEEFICTICAGVLEDPLITHCDHLFCFKCIHDWLRANRTCPIDRLNLRKCMLKPAPRSIRNIINRLPIQCDFQPDGCPQRIPLEQYRAHLKQCPHNPTRLVKCTHWCNRTMTIKDMKFHNCSSELLDQFNNAQIRVQQLKNERDLIAFAFVLLLIIYFICPFSIIMDFIPRLMN